MRLFTFLLVAIAAACGNSTKLPGAVTTLAGSSDSGLVDASGTAARFFKPQGLAVDGEVIYVADTFNHSIRRVTADGTVTTIAGSIMSGFVDGPADQARFFNPMDVALDGQGNLIVADMGNNSIRRIELSTRAVSTLVGGGRGYADGPISDAKFAQPFRALSDPSGRTIYVADNLNHAIRRIDLDSSMVTTVAGTGTAGFVDGMGGPNGAAQLAYPVGLLSDGQGGLFVSERGNNVVRHISSEGLVSTLVGPAPGTVVGSGYKEGCGNEARFSFAGKIATMPSGDLVIADSGNSVLRQVTRDGCTRLLAGTPQQMVEGPGADGAAAEAVLIGPNAPYVMEDGRIYFLDQSRIRVFVP